MTPSLSTYIVIITGNQEVLDGLNIGAGEIMDSNQLCRRTKLAKAKFPGRQHCGIILNEGKEYIAQKKTVFRCGSGNWHPLSARRRIMIR